jgi:integrase/recombinase XerD
MAQGRQAKILSLKQEAAVLRYMETTRYPERNRVMFTLSVKAGMRAKEIASLTWGMVTDASGEVAEEISLPDAASKGKGGRTIPLNSKLKAALVALYSSREHNPAPHQPVICSERGRSKMSAASVTVWFHRLYNDLGLVGCSSHSGRRTFITRAAKRIVEAGGSLRDIQQLAGHANLGTTQRYIEGNSEAKRKLVNLI